MVLPSLSNNKVIEFTQVVKDYGRKRIGPLDLYIEKGRIVGFLGPNGSGKTTSIRLVLGLIRPSSGSVRLNGFDPIKNHIEALKNVGYSPELPNIQSFLTPEELLALVAKTLQLPESARQEETRRVLELVGLTEYAHVKVGKLSKGMVQRLSVAQAMVGDPKVLILDEPMIGLDPAGTAHLREVFRSFAKQEGGTVFLSSHMMNEVENLCDYVIMIHSGKLVTSGSISEVTRRIMGSLAITIEASGLTPALLEKIRKLEGVTNLTFDGESIEKIRVETVQMRDSAGSEIDLRPKIVEMIVQSGAKLYTIKPSDNLLESAYIKALSQSEFAEVASQ